MERTEIFQLVEQTFGITDTPYSGPSFLMTNGLFLDIIKNDISNGHSDVNNFLSKMKLTEYSIGQGCPLLQEQGWIRLDTIKSFIELPPKNLTREQYNNLFIWLDYLYERSNFVEVSPYKENPTRYSFNETSVDDVVARIKRYYTCGRLYEQKFPLYRKPMKESKEQYEEIFHDTEIRNNFRLVLPES